VPNFTDKTNNMLRTLLHLLVPLYRGSGERRQEGVCEDGFICGNRVMSP
jgi:hypothetical protein